MEGLNCCTLLGFFTISAGDKCFMMLSHLSLVFALLGWTFGHPPDFFVIYTSTTNLTEDGSTASVTVNVTVSVIAGFSHCIFQQVIRHGAYGYVKLLLVDGGFI